MKIVIAHFQEVAAYPPVINLIDNLLAHHCYVHLIGINTKYLPERILSNTLFSETNLPDIKKKSLLSSLKEKYWLKRFAIKRVENEMQDADILWTTTDFTVRWLGKSVLQYKHVMQLMELIEYYPMFPRFRFLYGWKFPIERYAAAAWRVVVPEQNRAYIQKTWWGLLKTPIVLPNKPYYTEFIENPNDDNLRRMKNDSRKIVLYSGVIGFDRDLEPFAKAIQNMGDQYALYVLANIPESYKKRFADLKRKYTCIVHLGYYRAPDHLAFFKYAHIGILPYKPGVTTHEKTHISGLNALYCAPNKIFEYAAFGLPMIGTDVLGLKEPFERYDIGYCCEELTAECLIEKIKRIESRYTTMSQNTRHFYDSVNLDRIIENIMN